MKTDVLRNLRETTLPKRAEKERWHTAFWMRMIITAIRMYCILPMIL